MTNPAAQPTPDPVAEAERIVRRSRVRAGLVAPLALAVSIGAGTLVAAPSAQASTCSAGSHVTYSKYSGTYCMPNTSRADKIVYNIIGGCVVGIFGGTLVSILGGCAAGSVGAMTSSIY